VLYVLLTILNTILRVAIPNRHTVAQIDFVLYRKLPIFDNAKKNNPGHPYLTFFTHRVTGNPKRTIVFLDLVCMYLLPHVCIKNIVFSVTDGLNSIILLLQNYVD
jgi:hypothetical protein